MNFKLYKRNGEFEIITGEKLIERYTHDNNCGELYINSIVEELTGGYEEYMSFITITTGEYFRVTREDYEGHIKVLKPMSNKKEQLPTSKLRSYMREKKIEGLNRTEINRLLKSEFNDTRKDRTVRENHQKVEDELQNEGYDIAGLIDARIIREQEKRDNIINDLTSIIPQMQKRIEELENKVEILTGQQAGNRNMIMDMKEEKESKI